MWRLAVLPFALPTSQAACPSFLWWMQSRIHPWSSGTHEEGVVGVAFSAERDDGTRWIVYVTWRGVRDEMRLTLMSVTMALRQQLQMQELPEDSVLRGQAIQFREPFMVTLQTWTESGGKVDFVSCGVIIAQMPAGAPRYPSEGEPSLAEYDREVVARNLAVASRSVMAARHQHAGEEDQNARKYRRGFAKHENAQD